MVEGGRKSFRIEELDEKFFFTTKPNLLVPYLDMINVDLNSREG
jgi:recombination protein U